MKQISTVEVEKLLKDKAPINLVDVREVEEVQSGKIPNAIHIPLGLLEFKMNELDKSKEYIMVCRSGARSSRATQFLEGQGYKVINMTGGMLDWQAPIE
jgi:rhodanese-related sulfurtransferase